MGQSAGISATIGGITGGWEGALNGFIDGAIDGYMWGGIFAGGAQILSGAFRGAAQIGLLKPSTTQGAFKHGLMPNRVRDSKEIAKILAKSQKLGKIQHIHEYGGQFFNIANKVKLDVGTLRLFHLHLWPVFAAHIPIGTIAAGIIGGF